MGATPYRFPGEVNGLEIVIEPPPVTPADDEADGDVAPIVCVPETPPPPPFRAVHLALLVGLFVGVGVSAFGLSLILQALD